MIRHIVTWTLKAEDAATKAADERAIVDALEALPAVIPQIRSFAVSRNSEDISGNSDLVLVAEYDDRAGLDAYISHPSHQAVVSIIRARVAGRAAIDVEI